MSDRNGRRWLADRERVLRRLSDRERALWIVGVALYGVGDTVTTFWGLSTPGVSEAGPIARPLIDAYGNVALLGIKLVTFAVFYGLWRLLRRPIRSAVPLALVVVGALVTVWNLVVIATASG